MTGFSKGRVRVIGDEVLGLLNAKRREPFGGDEDAINCRLALKTQLYVNGLFPWSRLCDVIVYGNGDLGEGRGGQKGTPGKGRARKGE
jgi:hypothetical protein